MAKKYAIILSVAFAVITVITRLTPHPWNFTPMGALFLFSGFYLPKRWMWVSLAALSVTDLIIGSYQWQVMMTVYGTYAITMLAAHAIKEADAIRFYKTSVLLGVSVWSAVLFFFTTNFAHWMWFGGYAHDLPGLMHAYIAGIPFFRNSLFGYVFYGAVFFGAHELVRLFVSCKMFSTKRLILLVQKIKLYVIL